MAKRGERGLSGDTIHKAEAADVAAPLGDASTQILFHLGRAVGARRPGGSQTAACLLPGLPQTEIVHGPE